MRRIGAADYDSLQKVTVAEIPRRALTAGLLKQAFPASDIDTARCRRLTEILGNRINPALLVSTLNGQEGSVHLAACSVLASTHTYVRPQDWREDLLLVLEYGGEYAVAVAFWQSGEETVTGQAAFIRADRTDALLRSAEEFCGNPIRIRVLTGENLKKTAI